MPNVSCGLYLGDVSDHHKNIVFQSNGIYGKFATARAVMF